eukprot:gene5976-6922_t
MGTTLWPFIPPMLSVSDTFRFDYQSVMSPDDATRPSSMRDQNNWSRIDTKWIKDTLSALLASSSLSLNTSTAELEAPQVVVLSHFPATSEAFSMDFKDKALKYTLQPAKGGHTSGARCSYKSGRVYLGCFGRLRLYDQERCSIAKAVLQSGWLHVLMVMMIGTVAYGMNEIAESHAHHMLDQIFRDLKRYLCPDWKSKYSTLVSLEANEVLSDSNKSKQDNNNTIIDEKSNQQKKRQLDMDAQRHSYIQETVNNEVRNSAYKAIVSIAQRRLEINKVTIESLPFNSYNMNPQFEIGYFETAKSI